MSDEGNNDLFPQTIQFLRTESLPDGRLRLVVACPSMAEYLVLPKGFKVQGKKLWKDGRDSARGEAYYTSGDVDRKLAA